MPQMPMNPMMNMQMNMNAMPQDLASSSSTSSVSDTAAADTTTQQGTSSSSSSSVESTPQEERGGMGMDRSIYLCLYVYIFCTSV